MSKVNFIKSKTNFITLLLIIITLILVTAKIAFSESIENQLPPLQKYPLPSSLVRWQNTNQDNYFQEIKPHLVGYLLWRNFPIKVYIESPTKDLSSVSYEQFLSWQKLAEKSVSVWQKYLPLKLITEEKKADILIYRRQPQLEIKLNPQTGLYENLRAKAATTTIKFFLSKTQPQTLQHRMIIEVNPNQVDDYLSANITHELGHALGIWGHSPEKNDIMYFSHTQEIPQVSVRDINTLKLIYQQATRLGGILPKKIGLN